MTIKPQHILIATGAFFVFMKMRMRAGVGKAREIFSLSTIDDNSVEMVIGEGWTPKQFFENFTNRGYEIKYDQSSVGYYFVKPNGQTFQLVPSFHKKGEILKY